MENLFARSAKSSPLERRMTIPCASLALDTRMCDALTDLTMGAPYTDWYMSDAVVHGGMKNEVSRVMPWRDPLASSILMLLLGVVLIVLRSGAVSVVAVFAGAVLIVYGADALSRGIRSDRSGDTLLGVLACIVGLLMIVASGMFAKLVVLVVALFMVVLGVMKLIEKGSKRRRDANIMVGVVLILIGLLFVLYPGAVADTVVLVVGIVLVVVSAVSIWNTR